MNRIDITALLKGEDLADSKQGVRSLLDSTVLSRIYEMALFHAERHTSESNFDLTLGGFVSSQSNCESLR